MEIDNGTTERANRDIALGRGKWTFFGWDSGGKTAAVLRSFVSSGKRIAIVGPKMEHLAFFGAQGSRLASVGKDPTGS